MTSPSKLAANHSNAQYSTGPRTADGKSKSSQNPRTHGLTAKHLKLADSEREDFDQLTKALHEELQPRGELESTLFDRILHAHWNLQKIAGLEADLFAGFDPFNDKQSLALNRLSLYRARTSYRSREFSERTDHDVVAIGIPQCELFGSCGGINVRLLLEHFHQSTGSERRFFEIIHPKEQDQSVSGL